MNQNPGNNTDNKKEPQTVKLPMPACTLHDLAEWSCIAGKPLIITTRADQQIQAIIQDIGIENKVQYLHYLESGKAKNSKTMRLAFNDVLSMQPF